VKSGETITKTLLGDPEGMRKADNWIGDAGQIGEYKLSDGRVARVLWLTINQTHSHVVVWMADDGAPPRVVPNVARVNAARETERILDELEAE
jgi:hypothetical protein